MQPFDLGTSWTLVDPTATNADAGRFGGVTYDGKHVYVVPGRGGFAARYEGATPQSSLELFDTTAVDPRAKGLCGAVWDGQHRVYFVPSNNGFTYDGFVVRFDTSATPGNLSRKESWQTFESEAKGLGSFGFCGGAFDGRHVYFAPLLNGRAMRYDTTTAFGATESWSTFEMTKLDPIAQGFRGAAFDGRYVYFVPTTTGSIDGGSDQNSILVRFDTRATSFTDESAWAKFDTRRVHERARRFAGAIFDGRWLYLVPEIPGNDTVVRFDARSPAALPDASTGSFL